MTQPPPDMTAFELSAAQERMAAAGWSVVVVTTSPAGDKRGDGDRRVVRQRVLGPAQAEFVVAHVRYV